MSMKVKEGYVNPLTMMGKKKNALTMNHGNMQKSPADKVQDLQLKQQNLRNQMLMMKTMSSDAPLPEETQKAAEVQLEEVQTQLTAAKAQAAAEAGGNEDVKEEKTSISALKQMYDTYEKGAEDHSSPGLYQLQPHGEKGWQVKYSPYSQ